MRIALIGANGRMGLAVARLAYAERDVRIVGAVAAADEPSQGRDIGELAGVGSIGVALSRDTGSALLGAEVAIDFSSAAAVRDLATLAARAKVAIVSGTTNLDAAAEQALERASQVVPVLWAPNMSLGIQVLAELVEQALRRLGQGYDAEIVEIHHGRKVDAPSGTARRLLQAVRNVRGRADEVSGRNGEVGARRNGEVGVLAVRGGDVVGDHTVYLLGLGERIELTHRAASRDVFAHGALRAARFVRGKPPGRYTIADVLG